jgi:bifunctional non-homologous end joining protein LigD
MPELILGVDGVPDFNALHSRKHDHEVQFYAFDALALAGDDLRALPLSLRKTNLARLFARRPEGIFVRHSSKARSVPTYSTPLAAWDLRAWCRSGVIDPIGPAVRRIGRRSKTERTRPWKESEKPSLE